MDWIEITVHTNTAGSDMVSDLLMRCGASGTAIEDRNDAKMDPSAFAQWDLLDADFVDQMQEDVLVRGYISNDERAMERTASLKDTLSMLASESIGFDAGTLELSIAEVREEDWAENWKKHYTPFRVGKRIVIRPVWECYAEGPEDIVIVIDPGMAFGNATHETTSMCLSLLEEYVMPGYAALDVGTGSGILAIAMAMLGASSVRAVDLDSVAINVARKNVERNLLSDQVIVEVANLLEGSHEQADVIVANIIANAIILLSQSVRAHLKPHGVFIASGIIRDRERDVLDALQNAGLAVEAVRYAGEWVAVVATINPNLRPVSKKISL